MIHPDLILAGRLIDGSGAPPAELQAIVLRDGRIEAVLPQSDLTRTQREEAAVLDLGVQVALGRRAALGLSYSAQLGQGVTDNSGSLYLRVRF